MKEKKNNKAASPKKRVVSVHKEPIGERLPYPGGFPVYLSRYVLFGGEAPRIAMRFFNGSDILITGLRLRITEKDKNGAAIAEYPLERLGLFAEIGKEFSVPDSAVGAKCVAVDVQLEAVISDSYEYIVKQDGVQLRYGVEPREREFYFEKKPTYSVSKRKKKYIALAFLAVLGTVLLAWVLAWRVGAFEEFGIDGSFEQLECFEEQTLC